MASVYESGRRIPELGGVVRGGVTVVIDQAQELHGLQALCALAGRPPEDPIRGIYQALTAPELSLAQWRDWQRRLRIEMPTSSYVSEERTQTDWELLATALSLAGEMWTSESKHTEAMCLALSVADPSSNSALSLGIEADNPALVLHRGSLRATLIGRSIRAVLFSVALVSRRGIAPSRRADNLLEALRARVLEDKRVRPLSRLDETKRGELQHKDAVVVFLHGLMSTDLGFFDSLISQLQMDEPFARRIALRGWPHDTLTGIDGNAVDLAKLIKDVTGHPGPRIAFVCHSRGGLLARSAAVKLYAKKEWRERLRCCVTFGTPHEGAALAEAPEDFLGAFTVLQFLRKARTVASLTDVLHWVSQRRTIEGVKDLRPVTGGGDFLNDLVERESAQATAGEQRILRICAVGGVAPRRGIMSLMSNWALASEQHDLVVELESAASRFVTTSAITDCDHFGYLEASETTKVHFPRAINFLKEELGVGGAERANRRAAKEPGGSPGGHLKLLHSWPGQNPPPGGRRDGGKLARGLLLGSPGGGLLQAPAFALEFEQVAVVHEPIEERGDHDDVA